MSHPALTISYQDLFNTGGEVTPNAFGGIYTSFRPFENYSQIAEELGATLVRWPGGTLSEVRTDRYGLEFENLQAPNTPRPGLTELIASTNEGDQALSIILPTLRYKGDTDGVRSDVASFLARLADGEFGEIRNELILEIGNEYYAHFDDVRSYGEVANAILEEIARARSTHAAFFQANTVTVAMQMARNDEDDATLRSLVSDDAKSVIDYLRTHRLSVSFNASDHRLEDDQERFGAWKEDILAAGGDEPGFYLSAWNSASWTRNEALEAFTREHRRHTGERPDIPDSEFAERTHQQFETFWETGQLVLDDGRVIQTRHGLANRDYGAAKEGHILQIFTSYAYHGLDAAAIYGIDIIHPSAFGFVTPSGSTLLAGGGAFSLMARYLPGLEVTTLHQDNHRAAEGAFEINQWGFNSEDYAVIFVGANGFSDASDRLPVDLKLEFLPIKGWGLSILHDIPPDWHDQYGIPKSPVVAQTEEAKLYSAPSIEAMAFTIEGGTLSFEFEQDYQVAAFLFAHNETGAARLADKTPFAGQALTSGFRDTDIRYIQDDTTAYGDDTDDVFIITGSNNRVGGGAGNDVLIATGKHGNTLWGGEGDDVLIAAQGDNRLVGGPGNDRIVGGSGNDVIHGGEGNDIISVESGNNRIVGGPGSNIIFGGTGNDRIFASDPDISDTGAVGNSFVFANAGRNTIVGGNGRDVIIGGTGNDEITSFGNHNQVFGNGGSNTVHLHGDHDQFFSGTAREHVFLHGEGTELFIDGETRVVRIENFDPRQGHKLFLDSGFLEPGAISARDFVLDHAAVNDWGNVEISIASGQQRIILPGFGDPLALEGATDLWTQGHSVDDIVSEYAQLLDISSILGVSTVSDESPRSETPVPSEYLLSGVLSGEEAQTDPGPTAPADPAPAPGPVTVQVHGPDLGDLVLTSQCGSVSIDGEKVSQHQFTFDLGGALQDLDDMLLSFKTTTIKPPTATDALDILRLAVGVAPNSGALSEFVQLSADVNGDGRITGNDALMALRMAVGIEQSAAVNLFLFDHDQTTPQRLGADTWLTHSDILAAQDISLYGVGTGSLSTLPSPDPSALVF